jgi:hypothetical protein
MIAYSWVQFGGDVVLFCGVAVVIALFIWLVNIALNSDEQEKK